MNHLTPHSYPEKQGLYDPQFEHDSCGVGFIVDMKNRQSHEIIQQGLTLLCNLTHRGAIGADPDTGDGAGILLQIPHNYFKEQCKEEGFELPDAGKYGVATFFLPQDRSRRRHCGEIIESFVVESGLIPLGWRTVPTDASHVGKQAAETQPMIRQLFIANNKEEEDQEIFERSLYVIRKQVRSALQGEPEFIGVSMSSRIIIYKGLLTAEQLGLFYKDLGNPDFKSALSLVHTRFPTNTFPRWDLAQPFRYLAHNGEINTLRGNINWMRSRRVTLDSPLYEDIHNLMPLVIPRGSDSACMDNVLEFLVLSGYSLPHAMMMMVPEAWETHPEMDEQKKAFYEYHEHLMEPWDGPAALAFTDGVQIGATLDRNGLRPARYVVTKKDLVVMASEVGAIEIAPEDIVKKGRLQPGKMFLVDTREGRIIGDDELKKEICSKQPYKKWLNGQMIQLSKQPDPLHPLPKFKSETLTEQQKIFGYSKEDINVLLEPMLVKATEASGSMGNDAPLAVLSNRPRLLYDYFKQIFAQVSNPAIDSIREELVMSLKSHLGPELNLLEPNPGHARMLRVPHPVLSNKELAQIKELGRLDYKVTSIPMMFKVSYGTSRLKTALDRMCDQAERAVKAGSKILLLTDRGVDRDHAPIPALLAVGAVHHYLIRKRLRHAVGLVVETGEAREIAHFCLLVGYGAGAINPYLAFETFKQMREAGTIPQSMTQNDAIEQYKKSIRKGMFKVFAKMGISTIQSYRGAQIFEAVGLHEDVVHEYFSGTPSRISGSTLEVLAQEVLLRHEAAYNAFSKSSLLNVGGQYTWRRNGEFHQINPIMIQKLQKAAWENDQSAYKEFSALVNNQSRNLATLRGLLDFHFATAIPLEEVEPVENILKRFATGAMSFGSISKEAHETLAIAMNRMGAKSNSGEGGEDPIRFKTRDNGDNPISSIKQVASGRFGVSIHYLSNCVELQIKVAQGAKPGEGGQLPGIKVSEAIAKVRSSTPGVTLISPPPHHDIYSIEDLAQLIFDLKNANPKARITVKLVAEAGVGTIAAGVAKARADMIIIAGHDGGTGASPLTSIKHTGLPWELGLSEAHQTLLLNRLRGRVRLQTDGQLKTGRDVVIAAMLGAEEFAFSTMPLVTMGCAMMRKCHLNTCPVGIATQNTHLRQKFMGKPEHVINYFTFVAEEVRELMAKNGIRKFDDMVGRTDLLIQPPLRNHWKAKHVRLDQLLHQIEIAPEDTRYCTQSQDHELDTQIDHQLIAQAKESLDSRKPTQIQMAVKNTDRSIGTMLSNQIAKRHGVDGLDQDTIHCMMTGSSGQSFGAFLAPGVTLELEGDTNDYTGKGLSGGRIIIYPPTVSSFDAEKNILVGNTVLYGATRGEVFFSGIAGERFAVRNSGATAVVEGVGDHGCEYMTGGRVVVLGSTGRNFSAGMSGGIAYVLDEDQKFSIRCNHGMVELGGVEDRKEQEWLHEVVTKHLEYTKSPKAKRLLKHWDQTLSQFVRIMPTEYRMVLEQMEKRKKAA